MTLPVLDSCNKKNLDGSLKATEVVCDSFANGQKMQASTSYAFSQLCGVGPIPWHKSEVTGEWVGNLSVSDTVASCRVSLRQCKFCAGETQTSAHAITCVCCGLSPEPLL
jgi:hypothetical protein